MKYINLIRFELIKSKTKTTRSFIFLFLLLQTILLFASFAVKLSAETKDSVARQSIVEKMNISDNFSLYFDNLSLIPILILCLFIMQITSKEYDSGIFKKHLIDGMEVTDIFIARMLYILLICLTVTVLSFILFLLIGCTRSNLSISMFLKAEIIGGFGLIFIKTYYFLLVASLLIIIFRTTAFAIGFLVLYIVIEKVMVSLLQTYELDSISDLLPLSCLNNYFSNMHFTSLIAMLIYVNIFFIANRLGFQKIKA